MHFLLHSDYYSYNSTSVIKNMKMTLALSYGLFVTVCCCIRGVCQDKAQTTVFVQHGRTATLSWNLPKPEIREFKVRHSSDYLFHVTDYNKVKVNDEYTLRTIFRGNISASGSGVFSFQLFDAGIWSADGNYSCYSGSPGSRGTIIAECGQRLVVIHIQAPYIVTQDTAQSSGTANLTCYSIIRSSPVSHLHVSVTWRRNDIKLTIDGKYQVSVDYGWFSYHAISYTNTSTISKDKSEDNATYACQVEVLKHLFRSDWSLGYVLDGEYGAEGDTNYTVLCVGDNATVTWRVPQYGHLYHVKSDSGRYIFRLESTAIYVEYFYWLRIIITEVITSSAANVIRFLLYDVTVADAGRYFCEGTTCEHVLIVGRVPTKPKITTPIKPQVGQNVTLICSTTSRSLPRDHNLTMTYIWRRGSTRMLSGGRHQMVGSNLTINGFKRQDYSCQATEEKGLMSEWSNNSVMEWPLKPEIMNLTVNGTFMITFSVNQTAKFTCVVEGYPPPHVHVVQVGSNKSSVGMLRRQGHVFDHVIHISSCSQFGQYFCRANNSMGTSEENAHVASLQTLPRKRDSKDCEIENETDGKPPSGKVKFTICAYPEPVVTKWYFAKYGNPRDITANGKYTLSTKPSTNNVYDFTFIITNITESDFGAYIFTFECDEATTDVIIIASRPKENAGSSTSSIIIGCSIVAIALISIAIVFLFRVEHIRDSWNIRFPQSFTTPTNNISVSLENMTDRGYDVIEDLSASIAVPGHRSVGSDVDYQEVRILSLSLELKNVDLESLDDLAIKEDETEKEKGSTSFGDDIHNEEEDECCEESVSDFAAGQISFPLTIADAFNTTVPETRSTVNETDEPQTDILDQREVMPFPTTSSDTVLVLLNQVINESDSLLLYSTEGKHAADCVTSSEYEYLRRQAQNDEYTTLKQDYNPSDSELH